MMTVGGDSSQLNCCSSVAVDPLLLQSCLAAAEASVERRPHHAAEIEVGCFIPINANPLDNPNIEFQCFYTLKPDTNPTLRPADCNGSEINTGRTALPPPNRNLPGRAIVERNSKQGPWLAQKRAACN
jgi:hypothetical protein